MKKLLFFLLFCLSVPAFSQSIGKLPYKQLLMSYKGDTLFALFDGDSLRLFTNKKWAFKPEIGQNKVDTGYLSTHYFTLKAISDSLKQHSGSPVTETDPVFVASVSHSITSTDITNWNAKEPALGNPSSSGYVLSSTNKGVRSWISNIPRQLKNYNANQDTVIRFPSLNNGKLGIWQDVNNGISWWIGSNSGTGWRLNTNNLNSNGWFIYANYGTGWWLTNNYSGSTAWYLNANSGKGWRLSTNNSGAVGWALDMNSGIGWEINVNSYMGWHIFTNNSSAVAWQLDMNLGVGCSFNSYTSSGLGIRSLVSDSVSNTSGALVSQMGKTASHLNVDGFGHTKLIQTDYPKITLGTGAGTGATYALDQDANDQRGMISITTGTSPGSSLLFMLNYAYPYKKAAYIFFVPMNSAAASLAIYGSDNSNTYGSLTAASEPAASTTYIWRYFVVQ